MIGIRIGNKVSRRPVIQGGMGVGVSLHRLAGSVAREGGVGVISTADIGFQEPDFDTHPAEADLRAIPKEIAAARAIAGEDGILGVNVMVVDRHYEETVRACVEAGIDLVISGAGMPMKLPELVAGSQTAIAPVVSSARAFQLIFKTWFSRYRRAPDLVIVEGPEAGGHLGFSYEVLSGGSVSLEGILSEVVSAARAAETEHGVSIPVVAAGGIYTGEDVARYLAMGAAGVQAATRFVATEECDASPAFKDAYVRARAEDIQLIKSPVGLPGRALRNPFIRRVEVRREPIVRCPRCLKPCHIADADYCITQALINAVRGDVDNGLIFCGSSAARIDRISTVREVLEELCGDRACPPQP